LSGKIYNFSNEYLSPSFFPQSSNVKEDDEWWQIYTKDSKLFMTMIKKYEGLKLFYIDVFNRSAGFQRGWKVNFSEFRLIRKINT